MTTKGGLIIEEGTAIKFDAERVDNYAVMMAKGLWARNTLEEINWDAYEQEVWFHQLIQDPTAPRSSLLAPVMVLDDSLADIRKHWLLKEAPAFREVFERGEYGQQWRGIFSYMGTVVEGGKASVWLMTFYGSHIAGVIFIQKEDALKK